MWIGSKRHYKEKPFSVKWPDEPIKALGVYFTYDQKLRKEKNFKFLRKGVDKVTRASVINEHEEGGLRMVDLGCMVKSLRLAWLKRIFSGTNGTWKIYLQHIMSSVGGLFFFDCNYNISDYTIPSQIYRELLLWWSQFRETFVTEEDWKAIIWNNKEIKVENKPVYYKHYVNARVICIQDLSLSLNSTDSYNQLSKLSNICGG